MTKQTFLWHDYETFGVVPRRDRPAQFAGVRTDAELNEIGEPLMIYCKPAPDYLPSPESCLITGITPQLCLERGLPEHEFAARIEAACSQPGTIGVGYNTIRFDDEVTRFLFWRNLIDPYGREWQNDCGRWDLLDVVRLCYALRPEGIEWPKKEDGTQSFRLEDLARANGPRSRWRASSARASPSCSTSRWRCARKTASLRNWGCRPCARRRGPSCTSRACSRPSAAAWP
jgi:exodeoxyribonuclease-1